MYTKDKTQRITLRLNEEQFNFVKMNAEMLDVSPSDFLRMVVNLAMASYKKAEDVVIKKVSEEGVGRANDKANINDFIQHS